MRRGRAASVGIVDRWGADAASCSGIIVIVEVDDGDGFWRGRTWRCRGANDEREPRPRSLGTGERASKVAAEQFVCSGEGRRGREGTDDVGRWDG